ncbi:hypothetical protein N7G274_001694 [Stereocaulon virgatum]|uniref:Uncharacterized protein n=1 Tax=Stereocaulon virgatum TaxID=373712 RepID=A0ABR4ANF7_9LECA
MRAPPDFHCTNTTPCIMRSLLDPVTITLLMLTSIAVVAIPDCLRPAPPPYKVPTIQDCEQTLAAITAMARISGNKPMVWSRHPPPIHGQKLPVGFSATPSNECEIVVDVPDPSKEDAFRMQRVADVGREIVETCLIGEAGVSDTVGKALIGRRGVVLLWLRKKSIRPIAASNLTEAYVLDTKGVNANV